MNVLRIAIVDDEELARRVIREYLRDVAGVEVVAECANGFEAVKAVSELHPDLLLLDVQMPKLTGFEVVDLIGREPAVIFVTAYDEFALRAFEVHAVDYLLKPFERDRLLEALSRARSRLERRDPPSAVRQVVADARPRPVERVPVRDGSRVHIIPVSRIDYIQAQDDYVAIRSEGRTHLKEQPLGELEAALDPARFVRIHRSYILNLDRLARVDLVAKDSRVVRLHDGTELPVSRAGYARLQEVLR